MSTSWKALADRIDEQVERTEKRLAELRDQHRAVTALIEKDEKDKVKPTPTK